MIPTTTSSRDHADRTLCSQTEGAAERVGMESRLAWLHLREINLLSDAVLQTDDGGAFLVHRAVLATSSRYFKVLFTSKCAGATEPRKNIRIPGVSGPVLKALIEYAYSAHVELTPDNITDLLTAADQFNILDLLEACCEYMRQNMDINNCIGIWEFAKTFFCFQLEKDSNRFILSNFVDVTESEEFKEWPIEKVVLLLNSEKLNVVKEEVVWEAGLKWIDCDPDDRKRFMHSIMRCVRLGLLDSKYFLEKVKEHPYVENNDMCRPIVIETLKFLWDLDAIGEKTEEVVTPFLATPRLPFSILFTIGGWSGNSPTNLIETYDAKADRWIEVNDSDPDGPRAYHKLAVLDHNIYVIGGFNGTEYFNSCRCFNAVTKKWTDIAPMHSKRCYVSVATLDGRIYAMGGYDGHHRQNTAEVYNVQENQWNFISPMHAQRSDASAASLNGLIYIVGGFNGTECLPTCECYNPDSDQWTSIQPMRHRRSGVSAIAFHGSLYALGGFNSVSRLPTCEKFDPLAGQWTDVADMFNQRSNFATEVIDDMVFVIGGFNGLNTIYHVECYSDHTNEWYEATDMNHNRSALAACVVPGLPNVEDYSHPNRQGLIEEKRQRLLQQRSAQEAAAARLINHPNVPPPPRIRLPAPPTRAPE